MESNIDKALASKAVRLALAVLLAVTSLLSVGTALPAGIAYGAESANLTTGGKIPYGGYSTTWMYADGEMAYCADPQSASTPPATSQTQVPPAA